MTMKSERKTQSKVSRANRATFEGFSILAVALVALPLLALTPNFFIIPDLSYQGNATQEVAVPWAASVLLGAVLLAMVRTRMTFVLDREVIMLLAPLAAFLAWTLLSLTWAPEVAEGLRLLTIWLCFAVFFSIALLHLVRRSRWWLFYSLSLLILVLTGSQFIEYWRFNGEMLGVFFSHGITSELLALTLPLQLTVYLTTRKKPLAVASFLLAGAGAVAMLLTLRRGALLGVGVAVVVIVVALFRGWLRPADRWRLIVAAAAVLLLAGGLLTFKRQELVSRIRGALQLQEAEVRRTTELGLTSRVVKWLTAWEMGKRNPLIGVGNGGFPAEYGKYRRYFAENPRYARIAAVSETEDYDEIRSPHAHSEFLQVFAELGLVGVLIWGFFWIVVLRSLWRARSSLDGELAVGALAGVIAFGVSSLISGLSFRFSPGTVIAACVTGLGCAVAHVAVEQQQPNSPSPAAGLTLPRGPVIALVAILLLTTSGLGLRNRDVLNSQKTQSQIDFRFSFDSPATNESLLRRYQQVLDLDQANSGAHLGMGLLLYQLRRPAEAIPHIEYALTRSYGRPYTHVLLAFANEQTGNLEKADAILSNCLASFPRSIVARAARAALLERQGKTGDAARERIIVEAQDAVLARSWENALKMKEAPAIVQAKRQNLIAPANLEPGLARALVQARAYHYLN